MSSEHGARVWRVPEANLEAHSSHGLGANRQELTSRPRRFGYMAGNLVDDLRAFGE